MSRELYIVARSNQRESILFSNIYTDQSFIQVYDAGGKEIKLLKLTASLTEIDLSQVASGFYFILYGDGQNSKLVKIVKN